MPLQPVCTVRYEGDDPCNSDRWEKCYVCDTASLIQCNDLLANINGDVHVSVNREFARSCDLVVSMRDSNERRENEISIGPSQHLFIVESYLPLVVNVSKLKCYELRLHRDSQVRFTQSTLHVIEVNSESTLHIHCPRCELIFLKLNVSSSMICAVDGTVRASWVYVDTLISVERSSITEGDAIMLRDTEDNREQLRRRGITYRVEKLRLRIEQ